MSYNLTVIVPVYNEQGTILTLLEKLVSTPGLATREVQYIVVDDGSNDGTSKLLKDSVYSQNSSFVFLSHEKNQGKGSAIRTGLAKAQGEYTIIQDADLEYDPADIVVLLEHAEKNNLDVVFGSRNLSPQNKKGTFAFYWGGKTLSWLTSLLFGQHITDEPTCYKLIRTNLLKRLPLTCRRFEFCPEVTALLAAQGIKITELPISYFPRSREQGKKIGFIDWLEAVWTLLRIKAQTFNNIYGYILFALAAMTIVFLRKPETFLHPQLWGEDGKIWFQQAYNIGPFKSLFISDGGYFQTVSRLGAALGLIVPLSKVPLLFNSMEFLIQVAPALFLMTPRFNNIMPKISSRLLLAGIYLLLPNTAEVDGHLTSSQWYLAVLAFLVLIAAPPVKNRLWKLFDALVLVFSGLTGTFSIFFIPIAAVLYLKRRSGQSLLNFCIVFFAGVVQMVSLFLLSHEDRVHVLPQLNFTTSYDIFSRQVIWGLLSGAKGYEMLLGQTWLIIGVALMAICLMAYALIKAPWELKLFLLFGLMIFFATLITPTKLNMEYPFLKILSKSTDGIRYWLMPMLSFGAVLVWGLSKINAKAVRVCCALLLVLSIFGIIVDFRHLPYPDNNFNFYAKKFSQLDKGEHLSIPITPPGWQMELIKH